MVQVYITSTNFVFLIIKLCVLITISQLSNLFTTATGKLISY